MKQHLVYVGFSYFETCLFIAVGVTLLVFTVLLTVFHQVAVISLQKPGRRRALNESNLPEVAFQLHQQAHVASIKPPFTSLMAALQKGNSALIVMLLLSLERSSLTFRTVNSGERTAKAQNPTHRYRVAF